MSQMLQPDADLPVPSDGSDGLAGSLGLPGDNGWATWEDGRCSITRCLEGPVAAVERASGPRRPAHWQPYCATHARARGVEIVDDELVWTMAFLAPSDRHRRTRAD